MMYFYSSPKLNNISSRITYCGVITISFSYYYITGLSGGKPASEFWYIESPEICIM